MISNDESHLIQQPYCNICTAHNTVQVHTANITEPTSYNLVCRRLRLKREGTRAEIRFRLSAKRTSPFKSTGGPQFSRLLAAEVCASAVVMLDTPCSEVVWRVLATHSIRQFPLHSPARVSPCAITFQLDSTRSDLANSQQTRNIPWIWVCNDGHCLLLVSSAMKIEESSFHLNVGKFPQ